MGKDSALYFMPLKETVQPQNDGGTRKISPWSIPNYTLEC